MISSDHADNQGHNNGDHYKWTHSAGEGNSPYHWHYHEMIILVKNMSLVMTMIIITRQHSVEIKEKTKLLKLSAFFNTAVHASVS